VLKGIKVLSFAQYLQGPSGVQTLADLGADVIKIEPLTGAYERKWSGADTYLNGVSVFFLVANRNQRSMAINLKTEEGKQIIYDLVKAYDVVIENFRPGVMDRLGFSYETLKKINPSVIYCSCSGWGETGPYSRKDGQDVLAQSVGGLIAQSGPGDHPPVPVGNTVVDVHGGALSVIGILAAIYNRQTTGEGHLVETCLLNAAIDLQMESFGAYLNSGNTLPRAKTGLASRIHAAIYGVYRTKDGYITVNCRDEEKIKKAFGENVLGDVDNTFSNRYEIDRILAAEISKKTTDEWMEILGKYNIRHAPVNEYPDVEKDPQVIHNQVVFEMEHPVAGTVRAINHANRYNGKPLPLRMLPPDLGEHSKNILQECGYNEEQITELLAKGVIKKSNPS